MNLYRHKESNIRKTWLLITMSLLLLIGLGWILSLVLGDVRILYGFAVFSIITNLVAYWYSDKIALSMSGAHPVTREQNPYLYCMIENLTITAGLPMPRVYVMPSAQINAFATGRNPKHAAVAVTQGALEKLQNEELEGVLAHEISHIGNRDILVSTIVVVLAGIISMLADVFLRTSFFGGRDDDNRGGLLQIIAIVAALLAPLAATLVHLSVSRKREYLADASGALLTRYPDGLANALEKIAYDQTPMRNARTATAHLFLSNPFRGREKQNWFTKLFMTHPPLEERIKILRGMRV
ncbi:MAG: M48 family metallopeptidase [bacterium]|nr:M48 family metallopeptidase [bacterium]